MNYHESARTRKTGLSTLILNKLMSGGSVGSSIKDALSDRMQASVMGLKEKFDPLNIASKLTGGSRIGPALLGRMTGRNKEDIDYFANKRRVHRFDNVMNQGHGSGDSRKSTEILENIYSFMVKTRESQIKDNHSSFKFENERQQANQRRHDEVMNVFTEATKRNRQAVGVIAKPKAIEKPPEAPPAAPPAPPKPGVSPKPEPAKPAPPSAPAPAPAKPTVKPTEPVKAPAEVAKPPTKPVEPVKPQPEVVKQPPKPIETAKPVPKVEPTPPPSAAPAPPAVKPPSAAPVKPITETSKTAAKVAVTGAVVGGLLMPNEAMARAIDNASKLVGVDKALMYAIAKQESGFNPNAGAKTSSAKGLYQFVSGTWKEMGEKHGSKYPILKQRDVYDPEANAIAGALYLKDNSEYLKKNKIPINATNLYATHFLGAGGATVLLKADRQKIAADILPKAAKSNEPIFYKTKKEGNKTVVDKNQPKTVGEVIDTLFEKVGKYEQQYAKILANNNGANLETVTLDNADMKKTLNQNSKPLTVAINNTTNVSNRETTVMPNSDKGSENPQYKRA